MSTGTLTIYNASAGSGKTHALTGIYLSSLFQHRLSYRRILAVTFTNKATAEMKSRILENLHRLATGGGCDYIEKLKEETGQKEEWIRGEAGKILNSILHDFSRFNISTIDSFFQKIIRAFAREAGLHANFSIELDHDILLVSAVDELIASAVKDKLLKNWLISYAESNIEEEKSWNLRGGIISLAQELFKENFRILSEGEMERLSDKNFLTSYIKTLNSLISSFEQRMTGFGAKALLIFSQYGLSDEMFFKKSSGIPKYVNQLSQGIIVAPGNTVREIMAYPPRWSTGAMHPQLASAVQDGLEEVLTASIAFYDGNIMAYKTARAIKANIYALGILADILRIIHNLTTSGNTFLLSDAGQLLKLILKGDQTPFIYKKVGNVFGNFMIDEFQDTSLIQWHNFKPLIDNSMAEGSDNLVVGDIKQSIYRWRNSDWRILGTLLDSDTGDGRTRKMKLGTNWRSRTQVIEFNNALFTVLPSLLDEKLIELGLNDSFTGLYSEAVQDNPGKRPGGYVRIEFIENGDETTWQDRVLEKLPSLIESLQDKGFKPSDIGIIVREGREGAMALKSMIDYSSNCDPEKKSKYNYNIVSNDSLLLSASPAINLIIAVITSISEPGDLISRAAISRFFMLATGKEDNGIIPDSECNNLMPDNYLEKISSLREIPLFEAVEQIIDFFGLGKYSWNVAYLDTFQDHVLGFMSNGNPDIKSFLEWWETSGSGKSVVLPDKQDAMRILTIHKSKGLEFSAVIVPFLAWGLDHSPFKQPLLWVKPSVAPFDELGIVPVKCNKDLGETIFGDYFREEKFSAHLDNLNLLYVALTRAKDVLYGFSVNNPKSNNSIAGILKNAFTCSSEDSLLHRHFDAEKNVFETGEIPGKTKVEQVSSDFTASSYDVCTKTDSLRLKLHGENYFSSSEASVRRKINYGKLMHEIFEGIDTSSDISPAVRKLVLEGKLPEEDAASMEQKINQLVFEPSVSSWFSPENTVMKEMGILLKTGNIRRPDRVIFRNGKTTIIDFKFGSENKNHIEQVNLYRDLLKDMGYADIDAFLWYADKNKIVTV
jgi:ATP-dependent exoDNAse (exonuclease V) beta subunit